MKFNCATFIEIEAKFLGRDDGPLFSQAKKLLGSVAELIHFRTTNQDTTYFDTKAFDLAHAQRTLAVRYEQEHLHVWSKSAEQNLHKFTCYREIDIHADGPRNPLHTPLFWLAPQMQSIVAPLERKEELHANVVEAVRLQSHRDYYLLNPLEGRRKGEFFSGSIIMSHDLVTALRAGREAISFYEIEFEVLQGALDWAPLAESIVETLASTFSLTRDSKYRSACEKFGLLRTQ